MARMIPPGIREGTTSPGEIDLFGQLRDDPETADWVVLHSLDLPEHVRQIKGEIDFVVIVPGSGVLCIEVKAHSNIRRDKDGTWHLGTQKPTSTGPFKQISDATHSLRDRLTKQHKQLRNILIWDAVCFTNVSFMTQSDWLAEWHPWQVIDAPALARYSISHHVLGVLAQAKKHIRSKPTGNWIDSPSSDLTKNLTAVLINALRPDFEFYETPKHRKKRINQELIKYTEDQFIALDAMLPGNPRVVFEGAAGTGKTLLAIEEARRCVDRGQRVLFCCFNKMLSNWLKDQFIPDSSEMVISTIHAYMGSIAKVKESSKGMDDFYRKELPQVAIDNILLDSDVLDQFDVLIVDEAQDILYGPYLDFLDLVLKGGINEGNWRLFGDFNRQAIYQPVEQIMTISSMADEYGASIYRLTRNCRNTPETVLYLQIFSNLPDGYTHVLRPNGFTPKTIFYGSSEDQSSKLEDLLIDLKEKDRYASEDIVILSTKNNSDSSASQINTQKVRDRLCEADNPLTGRSRYCTIHAFKGLEAPVIIITDIEDIASQRAETLFYVSVSRATERVYVLASENVQGEMSSRIVSNVKA